MFTSGMVLETGFFGCSRWLSSGLNLPRCSFKFSNIAIYNVLVRLEIN